MLKGPMTIVTVAGLPVRLHWTFLVLLAWVFAAVISKKGSIAAGIASAGQIQMTSYSRRSGVSSYSDGSDPFCSSFRWPVACELSSGRAYGVGLELSAVILSVPFPALGRRSPDLPNLFERTRFRYSKIDSTSRFTNSRCRIGATGPPRDRNSTWSHIIVPPSCFANVCSCRQSRNGPRDCSSTKRCGGSQVVIDVRHRRGTPCTLRRYSIKVPARSARGWGVSTLK
jgi:hypothetical protein